MIKYNLVLSSKQRMGSKHWEKFLNENMVNPNSTIYRGISMAVQLGNAASILTSYPVAERSLRLLFITFCFCYILKLFFLNFSLTLRNTVPQDIYPKTSWRWMLTTKADSIKVKSDLTVKGVCKHKWLRICGSYFIRG